MELLVDLKLTISTKCSIFDFEHTSCPPGLCVLLVKVCTWPRNYDFKLTSEFSRSIWSPALQSYFSATLRNYKTNFIQDLCPCFKIGPASFIMYFRYFQTNTTTNFITNICEKCPSSMRCWDSNARPLECESPPITTRPGLP